MDVALEASKPKPNIKIILFTKSGFHESPRTEKRKHDDDDDEPDERTTKKLKHGPKPIDDGEPTGRTRSAQPKLSY